MTVQFQNTASRQKEAATARVAPSSPAWWLLTYFLSLQTCLFTPGGWCVTSVQAPLAQPTAFGIVHPNQAFWG